MLFRAEKEFKEKSYLILKRDVKSLWKLRVCFNLKKDHDINCGLFLKNIKVFMPIEKENIDLY